MLVLLATARGGDRCGRASAAPSARERGLRAAASLVHPPLRRVNSLFMVHARWIFCRRRNRRRNRRRPDPEWGRPRANGSPVVPGHGRFPFPVRLGRADQGRVGFVQEFMVAEHMRGVARPASAPRPSGAGVRPVRMGSQHSPKLRPLPHEARTVGVDRSGGIGRWGHGRPCRKTGDFASRLWRAPAGLFCQSQPG